MPARPTQIEHAVHRLSRLGIQVSAVLVERHEWMVWGPTNPKRIPMIPYSGPQTDRKLL